MLANQIKCLLLCGDHTSGYSHTCLTKRRRHLFLMAGPLCRPAEVDHVYRGISPLLILDLIK